MLLENFDFSSLPTDTSDLKLEDIGMLASKLEDIDYSMVSWLKTDLNLHATTNEDYKPAPVIWVATERAFQIKNNKELRDINGLLKLPLITVERTSVDKDPDKKGGFYANLFSNQHNGRSGRFVIAREIKQDKTRNFARVTGMRSQMRTNPGTPQTTSKFPNPKVVIRTLSIPIPVYVNLNYKIVIQTDYQTQMNELVTPFLTRTGQINSFVLRRNGHLYEAFIDGGFGLANNAANLGSEDRTFKTEINIRVLGYLIGEGKNDDRPIVEYNESAVEFRIPREYSLFLD